ncbi:hypothetical protein FE782_17565 [Paenibacillus antri]|uniref:Uncharacterized protein n=1 Tax=Paenibacillus antri TaxID=2582848 RepID=A0A5R9GBU8_9BACL|nr:hypothetical protein [Paenibacillus antri]TLS50858.1 hypothetical protein FE782_17565 [Paenibacillus antri]
MRKPGNGNGTKKNGNGYGNGNGNGNGKGNGKKKPSKPQLTPQQLAVVVGLLSNSLEVISVLLDKELKVQIVLEGSIRKQTKADRIAAELGELSVAELLEAFLRKQI